MITTGSRPAGSSLTLRMASWSVFQPLEDTIRRAADAARYYEPNLIERAVRAVIDRPDLNGFRRRVWLVAGSGFLTTSYCIFSTNVVAPAIQYVYPNCNSAVNPSLILNLCTLIGTIIGMIVFGFLADRYGRSRLYGVELVIVFISTVGMTSATQGKEGANGYGLMNIYGWLGFWRLCQGVGLGAEYPLSALIAVEWSSTQVRAKMLAAVFLMQSIGQLAAYSLGLAVLVIVKSVSGLDGDPNKPDDKTVAAPIIDVFWRVVIAIGVLPALIAIFLRWQLPETPLWLVANGRIDEGSRALGVVYPHRRSVIRAPHSRLTRAQHGRQPSQAEGNRDSQYQHQPQPQPPVQQHQAPARRRQSSVSESGISPTHPPPAAQDPSNSRQPLPPPPPPPPSPHSPRANRTQPQPPPSDDSETEEEDSEDGREHEDRSWKKCVADYLWGVWTYLARNDRLKALLGVMMVWFLVDIAYYGLGLDSPRTIQKIWLSSPVDPNINVQNCTNLWWTDPARPGISIYEMLKEDAVRNIITISTGAVTGSVVALLAIDYVPRVSWMACWFVALAAVFLVMGTSFSVAWQSDKYALTITLYVLAQIMFNLGPNTITFMLPAEMFDTRYRGTFYGLAAAAGKLGAVVTQVANSLRVQNGGQVEFSALLLGGMVPSMLLGAAVTWFWIPEVQEPYESHHRAPGGGPGSAGPGAGPGAGGGARRRTFRAGIWLRPNRTLEDIAENPSQDQKIGVRRRLGLLSRPVEDDDAEAQGQNGFPMGQVRC